MRLTTTLLCSMLTLIGACAYDTDVAGSRPALTASDEAGILDLVNDQTATSFEVLDVDCAIRSDSAANIIAHRDGPDGRINGNDDLFDTFAELDDVYMVGPWTLDQLRACAVARGYIVPPACTPAPFVYTGPGSAYTDELLYSELNPEMMALADALAEDAEWYRDDSVYFGIDFSHVQVYTDASGAVIGYTFAFVQWIDPEGGIQFWVHFIVDTCLDVFDVDYYI